MFLGMSGRYEFVGEQKDSYIFKRVDKLTGELEICMNNGTKLTDSEEKDWLQKFNLTEYNYNFSY